MGGTKDSGFGTGAGRGGSGCNQEEKDLRKKVKELRRRLVKKDKEKSNYSTKLRYLYLEKPGTLLLLLLL